MWILGKRLEEEKAEYEKRRKEKDEMHLYITVKVNYLNVYITICN